MKKSRNASSATKPEPAVVVAALAPQAAHLLQSQRQIAAEIERFTLRWIERRRKAAETMIQAADEPCEAKHGFEALPAAMRSWQRLSIDCLAKDADDWVTLWSACASILTEGEIEAECEIARLAGLTNEGSSLPTRIPV